MPRGVRIGLKDVYYALLDNDEVDVGAEYLAPQRLVGAITANINPNPSSETLFADDAPMEVAATLGNIELELGLADLPLPAQAVLLGHAYSSGHLIRKADDIPPWLALGFRALKSNGNYRYVWLLKGKFMVPEEAHETKGDTITFQTPSITGNFVARDYDGEYQVLGDEDESDDFTDVMAQNWYDLRTINADKSEFTVAPSTATPTESVSFDLEFTDVKDDEGVPIDGVTGVTVVSDTGEDLSAFDSVTLDGSGNGDMPITLTTVGKHVLSIMVDGVLAIKTVIVDVQP